MWVEGHNVHLSKKLKPYQISMKLPIFISSISHPKFALRKSLAQFFSSSRTNNYEEPESFRSIFQRISPFGNPNASIVPFLDEYVKEGINVNKTLLIYLIKELKKFRRFTHALEVSEWMSKKTYFEMSVSDAALRIDLIYKVQGLEHAESYFSNISQKIKHFPVYTSLLNCYAQERCVEKAECLMQKINDLGHVKNPLYYNILMNLYYRVGNFAKLDDLMKEMNEEGIAIDKFTLTIRMRAHAAASDAEGVNKIVTMLESDYKIDSDIIPFIVASHACLKVGLVEKSLQMIKEVEKLTKSMKSKFEAYNSLLHFYSEAGKKDDFLRIWDLYKQEKIFNKGYLSMMRGLMVFDDYEGMEKIFQEWDSKKMPYDFRIPDFLIEAYCRKGHPEKAEVLLEKGISRGGVPFATTWYHLAGGYITTNQVPKAVDALKKAISICPHNCPLSKNNLSKCVEYLESSESRKTEEFRSFLEKEGLFSAIVRDKLFQSLSSEENFS